MIIFLQKKATHSCYSNTTRILKTFSEFISCITDYKIIKQEFWPKEFLKKCQEFLCWKQCVFQSCTVQYSGSRSFLKIPTHYLRNHPGCPSRSTNYCILKIVYAILLYTDANTIYVIRYVGAFACNLQCKI